MEYSDSRILLNSQREGQVSRFRAWVMMVVPLAAILFQFFVPRFFDFLHFVEMPLLVVVYFAVVRRSQISGLMVGAVVGLAQDSLSKHPLGMFGIVKTLVGYFAASVEGSVTPVAALVPPVAGAAFPSVAAELLTASGGAGAM